MAAALMEMEAGGAVTVTSAGTEPGVAINPIAAEVLLDVGIDIRDEVPKLLTEELMRAASLVVVLGGDAKVRAIKGVGVEVWMIDEPSLRGIEGHRRMEMIRDEIHEKTKALKRRLLAEP